MIRRPVLVASALVLLFNGCGESVQESGVAAAGRARELYDKGQFRESQELFRQVIAQDGPSVSLLYNLGCALYRDGKLGEAIAAWESARLLSPTDPDLLHNIGVAVGRQVDRLPEVERSVLAKLLDKAIGELSADQWTFVVYLLYVLVLTALALRMFITGPRLRDHWATATFLLVAAALVSLACYGYAWTQFHRQRAVVTSTEVALHSGPDGSGKLVATLHAGLIVEVTGEAGQDSQIRLRTGWEGFVPRSALHAIGLKAWTAVSPS